MIKELRILVSVIGMGAILLVLIVRYTDICKLQAVTLNGKPVQEWNNQLGLNPDNNLFTQPVDSLADAMLSQSGIVDVNIKYQLPNSLSITTNSFLPVCYMLDAPSGIMFGLDETGRVVPLDSVPKDWEKPIFTGAIVRQIHDFSSDPRISILLPQIEEIHKNHPQVYPLIEEIMLDNADYVVVSISGLPYTLKVQSDKFAERFNEFQMFMAEFKPATSGVSCFDLTYDDMIIRVGYSEEKKKEPVDTSAINDKAAFDGEIEEPDASQLAQVIDEKKIAHDEHPTEPIKEKIKSPVNDTKDKSVPTPQKKNVSKQTNNVKASPKKSTPATAKPVKSGSIKQKQSAPPTGKASSKKSALTKHSTGKSNSSKASVTKPSVKKTGTLATKGKPQPKPKKSGKNG